jgi:hypothetical protein
MSRFNNFLFDRMDAPVLDGTGLQPDPDLTQRNLERARAIIKAMGPKWCCWLDRDSDAGRQFHKIKEALRAEIK